MAKFEIPSVLSRVRVGSPCEQDWNAMRGNARVRFCDHCAKNVHNLSEMTPEAALELVEQSEGRLCVRFIPSPDGSPHIKDDVEPLTGGIRIPLPRLAAGILSAALTLGAGALVTPAQPPAAATKPEPRRMPMAGSGTLVVTVTDLEKKPVPGAAVTVKHTKTGWSGSARTDETGKATFREIDPGFYIVVASAEMYMELPPLPCEVGPSGISSFSCRLESRGMMGEIATVSPNLVWLEHWEERQKLWDAFRKENPDGDFDSFPGRELLDTARSGTPGEIRKLIENGGNPNVQNRFGDTPAIAATRNWGDSSGMLEVILANGGDVNLPNRFGVTPLMWAAIRDKGVVTQLIAAGANVNAADDNGRTALMYAAFNGQQEVVWQLIRAGADVNARDAKEQSALSYALAGGDAEQRRELLDLLREAGAVE